MARNLRKADQKFKRELATETAEFKAKRDRERINAEIALAFSGPAPHEPSAEERRLDALGDTTDFPGTLFLDHAGEMVAFCTRPGPRA